MTMIVSRGSKEPAWLAVGGASVLFAPITRPMMRRARRTALEVLGKANTESESQSAEISVAEQLEQLGDAFSEALILAGAIDWKDVCEMADGDDESVGTPIPFSISALADVLADPVQFDKFDAAFVLPFATREREKNGSAASPNGIGGAATAAKITAGSRAPQAKARGRGAKTARTASKPRKATKPKASGTS